MSNRWLRFVIALLALGAAGAAAYRVFQQEQRLAEDATAGRAADAAAESAIAVVGEIKAAMHAYVAPGQGVAFWTTRAGMLLDKLRAALVELDAAASAAGSPLTDALDLSDRLAAVDERAQEYVKANQALLAGEVIFSDARDLLDAMRVQIAQARGQIAQAAGARQAERRREQVLLGVGAAGILALAVLILVPPGRSMEVTASPPAPSDAAADDVEYARVIPTPRAKPDAPPRVAPPTPAARATSPASATRRSGPATAPQARQAPSSPSLPSAPSPPSLTETAAVCSALARVSDSAEITALLGRASTVLNAFGIIVWIASEDRQQLHAAAASGYDERLFNRIGSIPRDASNLTATAFRDAASKTSAAAGSSGAALAVPLVTPDGAVGVFSAELREGPSVDADRLALSTIFAAQLSMLLGAIAPAADTAAPAHEAQG